MNNDNWYEDQMHFQNRDTGKRAKRSVSIITLIACMLITALLGGVAGGAAIYRYGALVEERAPVAQSEQASVDAKAAKTAPAQMPSITESLIKADGSSAAYSKSQIVDIAAPSIVGIDVEVKGQSFFGQSITRTGSGSGVIMSADGYIITNDHVIADATKIKVYLYDDTEYEAKLIGTDTKTDLAVIKIEAQNLHAATMGDSDHLRVGEDVVAIGNPLGEFRGSATGGMVSALSRTIEIDNKEMTLLQTDAAINPGNSGGGLFNAKGELIGIINAKIASSSVEGIGFAIPVNSAQNVIADLMDLGYVSGRAYLGVYTQNVALNADENVDGRGGGAYGWDEFFSFGPGQAQAQAETRVQIVQIVLNSAADRAGLKAGDLILALNGKEISTQTQLSAAIGEYKAGDVANIKIQRDGQELTLEVVFGELVPER